MTGNIFLSEENRKAAFAWAMNEARASGFPPEKMEPCRFTGLDEWYASYDAPHRSIFEGDAGNGFSMYLREYQTDKNLVNYMEIVNPGFVMGWEEAYRFYLRNGIYAWKQAQEELLELCGCMGKTQEPSETAIE